MLSAVYAGGLRGNHSGQCDEKYFQRKYALERKQGVFLQIPLPEQRALSGCFQAVRGGYQEFFGGPDIGTPHVRQSRGALYGCAHGRGDQTSECRRSDQTLLSVASADDAPVYEKGCDDLRAEQQRADLSDRERKLRAPDLRGGQPDLPGGRAAQPLYGQRALYL